jgi:hypothetical protein
VILESESVPTVNNKDAVIAIRKFPDGKSPDDTASRTPESVSEVLLPQMLGLKRLPSSDLLVFARLEIQREATMLKMNRSGSQNVMIDLGASKHHLTSRYQLIKLLRLKRLTVMSHQFC